MADIKPRLMENVIDAITILSERSGSSIIKITSIIKKKIEDAGNKPPLRNTVNEVQKAISYGVERGFLKKRNNKISLLIKRNDLVKKNKTTIKKKVKPKRKLKRYEKTRRSYASSTGSSYSNYSDSLDHYRQHRTGIKSYRRRGGGKRRRRRSRTRRRRRHGKMRIRRRTPTPANFKRAKDQHVDVNKKHNIKVTQKHSKLEPTEADDPITPENQNKVKQEKNVAEPHSPNECDNPNCLCKMKNEPNADENEYYT